MHLTSLKVGLGHDLCFLLALFESSDSVCLSSHQTRECATITIQWQEGECQINVSGLYVGPEQHL